ncbi:hypothetical protein SPRG_14523 [Saprolegnia parasitica CBS 223.65]|uniref:LACTB2 winged helix domain-containing protein n=1 Tax=Saprolegnia parasitica (strain CBS 223.65) TaxID=695850 RepID=A0A067BTQ3_SAPPC|nr:hypothetical protein SPRG_14523 [Saprolegnia parasitica CBS 223.65]KDO20175.1 hypothetical protein SPRG_14523 [Saprolegnia parasitica CBS 223.65]|eukprot:XP_012209124.1 hypothetical protein SPRG_14523 [Saprolegnia parasitica CBS 223.65]
MASLRALRACNPTRLYPGHGPVVEKAVDTIDMYLSHRQKREDEILAVLTSKGPVDVSTIVAAMYPSLPYLLSLAAARNVRMHLRKLLDDGQVLMVPSISWLSRTPRYARATVPSE